MELHFVQNDKVFIGDMVDALKAHLVEGTLLAALIVWLFLKSFRSTLIIACSIPVSLMGAIAVMYFFGYTFNSVTLLALLLLVGVVVDDAIVVLENIYRHREEDRGATAVSAAVTGSREVTFAVIAASFSLVAIFAPVVFVSGILGQFLRSFAVVVTFGVLVSLFVSLTLTPMLCSRYLDVQQAARPASTGRWSASSRRRARLPRACSAGRCATAAGAGRPRRCSFLAGDAAVSAACRASSRRRPTRAASWSASARRSARRSSTPRASCARSRRSPSAIPRSSPSSASSAWARRSRSTRRRWWRA